MLAVRGISEKEWMQMKRATALLCALILTACSQKTAEQQIADAKRLILEGEETAAIVELKNAVVTEPNNADR